MPWTDPVAGVAGAVITAAWSTANVVNPLMWLRQLTGNADPGASNRVVVSTGATTTEWKQVPADALAAGVAVANLGYTPLNRAGDTASATINFAAAVRILSGDGTNHYDISTVGTVDDEFSIQNINTGTFIKLTKDGVLTLNGATVWTSSNDGAGSGLDADRIDGLGSNELARLGAPSDFAAGFAPTYNGGNVFWRQDNDGSGSGLDADLWRGQTPAQVGVPSGGILFFKLASELTAAGASWALCDGTASTPDLRGRLLVAAGTTGTQTFTENTAYGSSWAHLHGVGSYTTTAAAVTDPPDTTTTAASGGGVTVAHATHVHPVDLLPMQGASADTTWLPYMFAGVFGRHV